MPPTVGNFPLSGVAKLPNVTVAFPGEHWSRAKAQEPIVPGEAVVEVNQGGVLYVKRAAAADSDSKRVAIALRTVQVPDVNTGPGQIGPNEIVNQLIPVGEYVHTYFSGAFHITLIKPDTYAPADLIGWDPAAARPTGKGGTGAWVKAADEDSALFSVQEFRPVNPAKTEGLLTVRSLRGQF